MRKLVTALIVAAAFAAVLGLVVPSYLDGSHGTDVILLVEVNDADEVEFQRLDFEDESEDAEWSPEERRAAVISIYGENPRPEPIRVLFVDAERLIRPAEDPELVLYPRQIGDRYAYQAKSAHAVGRYAAIGAVAALVILAMLNRFVFKRPDED